MRALGRFFIRVGALAAKETIHIRRDISTLYMALGLPVVLLLLFGFGVSFDIDHIPLAIVDLDSSDTSRELRDTFTASDDFRLRRVTHDPAEADTMFRRGEVLAVLVIPPNFERDLGRNEQVTVQLLMDGADANTTNVARGKADAVAQAFTLELQRDAQGGLAMTPPMVMNSWTRFNPEGRSALYLVPGLTAYILAIVAVLLTALTVAREWERGSMEQLFATPVGRLEIVVGKLIPYMVIGCIAVLLVLAVGAWVFALPFRGSVLLLALDSLLFITAMLGLGLLISVVTRNQMVATQAAAMASILPTMLLSNFMFPVENMPTILQWISSALPATYYIEALRGILLRGNGIEQLWVETLALAGFAAFFILVSTARFKRRLS